MADFVAQVEEINALARRAAGFVAQPALPDEGAVYTAPLLLNVSIWESVKSLDAFTHPGKHAAALERRVEWFEQAGASPNYVLYWIPEGHTVTEKEARSGSITWPSLAQRRMRLLFGNRSPLVNGIASPNQPLHLTGRPVAVSQNCRSRRATPQVNFGVRRNPPRCMMTGDTIQQQIEYYRARAGEYDEWFLRRGRYDRGADLNAQWFAEAGAVAAALDAFRPAGAVLELACGTGLWTARLAAAARVTAVDASAEMLAINRARVGSPCVTYIEADAFAWEPPTHAFDVVFFSFWLSHVPPERFDAFWAMVRRALRPGGRFFLIDSRHAPTSTAVDDRLRERTATTLTRRCFVESLGPVGASEYVP
jgi:demethylmenaquinone methyltransferase/2-methoxy-6-polyprenyl-1,4-benzoquinol methylase